MNCCICGPVKNCGPYLIKVLENMEKIGSLFDDYKIVIYYDTSSDNSLKILQNYQDKNPKMLFYVNRNPLSKFRTHNLSVARNFCLNYVKENKDTFPYFIMMDMDDVCIANTTNSPETTMGRIYLLKVNSPVINVISPNNESNTIVVMSYKSLILLRIDGIRELF